MEESGGAGPSPQVGEEDDADVDDGKQGISGIYVPRQKYIPISKENLLDGVVSMFESEKDADDFRRFAKYHPSPDPFFHRPLIVVVVGSSLHVCSLLVINTRLSLILI